MQYSNVVEGVFVARINRFVADVVIDGEKTLCHVKNTGRLKELFVPGSRVFLEKASNQKRKYLYDLIAVYKDDVLFNVDSQCPNKLFSEWVQKGNLFSNVKILQPEKSFQNSRFDFYVEADDKKIWIEVKGVTLESEGVLLFPDAPTERGVRHIKELSFAAEQGYGAYVVFIAKTGAGSFFSPNKHTHPAFAEALKKAKEKGVEVICLGCDVAPNQIEIKREIPVKI